MSLVSKLAPSVPRRGAAGKTIAKGACQEKKERCTSESARYMAALMGRAEGYNAAGSLLRIAEEKVPHDQPTQAVTNEMNNRRPHRPQIQVE